MTRPISIPQLCLDEGYALFVKSDYKTQMHQHYVIEAILCEEGGFDLFTPQTIHAGIKAVLIPSHFPHAFHCTQAACKLLFIDPLSGLGQRVRKRYRSIARNEIAINPKQIESLFDKSFCSDLPPQGEPLPVDASAMDKRIGCCLNAIHSQIDVPDITIRQLSRISFLSESRLSHLFKEQMGLSIHQYILWRKISLAACETVAGQSLTTSAYRAGFTDASHFNRAFSRMFGVTPWSGLKT